MRMYQVGERALLTYNDRQFRAYPVTIVERYPAPGPSKFVYILNNGQEVYGCDLEPVQR